MKQETERNKEIIKLYEQREKSMTLEQIGNKFGITRQRVRQIIKNAKMQGRCKKVIKN